MKEERERERRKKDFFLIETSFLSQKRNANATFAASWKTAAWSADDKRRELHMARGIDARVSGREPVPCARDVHAPRMEEREDWRGGERWKRRELRCRAGKAV